MNKQQQITNEFEALKGLRILVLGDVMIDSYLWGAVSRMSPEAPVPVVSVDKREKRLGGAANVALNLKALGCEPIVLSVIGADTDGEELVQLFENNNLSTEGLVKSKSRITTIKHRIISDKHLLRVDSEQIDEISDELKILLLEKYNTYIKEAKCVVFQDYDKGVLCEQVIQDCIHSANKFDVPTTVDPKKRNFDFFGGVTLFKPNLKEINEALGTDYKGTETKEITSLAQTFIRKTNIQKILITLSENGALLVTANNATHQEAHKRNIVDVSGAGDTVISVVSAFLATGIDDDKILTYSNLSGGLVCEHIGVVPTDKARLLEEALLVSK